MTRINAFIEPADLCDKHLLAEHREIVRIPNSIKAGRLSDAGQPTQFTLGTGHVKFFRNKLLFLHKRYRYIYRECKDRGFNVKDMGDAFCGVPSKLYNDFNPPPHEVSRIQDILIDRIVDRMPKNAKYTNINK